MSAPHPTYDLAELQQRVREGRYRVTRSALDGAAALGVLPSGIRDCVLGLRVGDFYKTMPAERVPGLWQDVYRPRYADVQLYVKLQMDAGGLAVVISFKER